MNKNQYVLTTRFVIYDNSEIIRITHEENGDWQFLGCEDNLKESDAVVVSLGEMMDFDNSLSVVDILRKIGFILTSMTLKKTIGMNAIVESKISANSGEMVLQNYS